MQHHITKKIKNNTAGKKTWLGQELDAGSYYEIQIDEELFWMHNTILDSDINSGDAIVNDGESDLTDPADGLIHLKAISATHVCHAVVDDSNQENNRYMKYDSNLKALKYVNPAVEMAFDADGDLLCDDDFNAITIDEDF